tara:strand:+ start:5492 stop:7405 length:1914 start_codon:yes stop_codon:yes gene_type:complete
MSIEHTNEENPALEAAIGYLEQDWSVIPINPTSKKPYIPWKRYQQRRPTDGEVEQWFRNWPDARLAVVTGELSGIVIVDCDSEEAHQFAIEEGLSSPVRVKTKRGVHHYFDHPRDGKRRGPRVGGNSRGTDWPKFDGIDFRGDGSYALLPPSPSYEWDIEYPFSQTDIPRWKDWTGTPPSYAEPNVIDISTGDLVDFNALDLSSIETRTRIPEWDATEAYIKQHFTNGKLPTGGGNGRNDRMMRHLSDMVLEGYFGEALRKKGKAFMARFFEDDLPDYEFEATASSVERMERENHPERWDQDGNYTYGKVLPQRKRQLLTVQDADALVSAANSTAYFADPFLWKGSITQLHGYSGSGKSMFLQHLTYAIAAGQNDFGPFELNGPANVLYFDYENGRGVIGKRFKTLSSIHGDAGEAYKVWASFLDDKDINLTTRQGVAILEDIIKTENPDIVILDTVRSAFLGLDENNAEAWSRVNHLMIRLRDAGLAVIFAHHSNKPGESGLGREAGSTNQLTVLDTQVRVAQVYKHEETAKQNAGLWDMNLDTPVWLRMEDSLPEGFHIKMLLEFRYKKVREWTDNHQWVQYIGFAMDNYGDEIVVGSKSPKSKARAALADGLTLEEIADKLSLPYTTIKKWIRA